MPKAKNDQMETHNQVTAEQTTEEPDTAVAEDYEVSPSELEFAENANGEDDVLEESIADSDGKPRKRKTNRQKAIESDSYAKNSAFMEDARTQAEMYYEQDAQAYFDEEEAVGEKGQLKDDIIHLLSSVKISDILEGEVTGFWDAHPVLGPAFMIAYGHRTVRVWIPIKHFIPEYDESVYLGPDKRNFSELGLQRLRSRMQSYRGAKIKFVCIKLFEQDKVAYGSRLQALDTIGHYYYQKPNMKTKKPPLEEGKAATGTIISVMADRVVYDVCGTDVTLRGRDLSYLAQYDLTKEPKTYYVGARHRLRITEVGDETKVEIGERTYRIQHVKASRKLEMINPNQRAYENHEYAVGQTVGATIKSENKANGIYVNLEDRVICLCDNTPGNPPLESTCMVVITHIYEDYAIRGKILPGTIVPPRNNYTF